MAPPNQVWDSWRRDSSSWDPLEKHDMISRSSAWRQNEGAVQKGLGLSVPGGECECRASLTTPAFKDTVILFLALDRARCFHSFTVQACALPCSVWLFYFQLILNAEQFIPSQGPGVLCCSLSRPSISTIHLRLQTEFIINGIHYKLHQHKPLYTHPRCISPLLPRSS